MLCGVSQLSVAVRTTETDGVGESKFMARRVRIRCISSCLRRKQQGTPCQVSDIPSSIERERNASG